MRRLTKKQKKFADRYLDTGNGTKSALEAYDTEEENCAAVIASENLRKLNIQEYLEDKARECAIMAYELAKNAQNENVRLGACKDLMDRGGLKPIERTDITSGGKPIPLLSNALHDNNGTQKTTGA